MTIDDVRSLCAAHAITIMIGDTVRQADAARLLGVSVRTLQRWRLVGTPPLPTRIGRRLWRYSLADLAEALSGSVARREPEPLPAVTHREHSLARPADPCSLRRSARR